MNDALLVRVVHGGSDTPEQTDTLTHVQLTLFTPFINCFAFQILRDEVGPAFFGGASIVNSSDVRVFERREDLTLPLEPLNNLTGGRFRRDHFDRHLLLEHSVVSPGQIDRTHASAANLARVT